MLQWYLAFGDTVAREGLGSQEKSASEDDTDCVDPSDSEDDNWCLSDYNGLDDDASNNENFGDKLSVNEESVYRSEI
ncbi:hypothetical protein M0802_015771 [Mischocyttarus mexicanus]|nr:hypothetical protein M0802_015771 [Mischocyttarus mexicanus]